MLKKKFFITISEISNCVSVILSTQQYFRKKIFKNNDLQIYSFCFNKVLKEKRSLKILIETLINIKCDKIHPKRIYCRFFFNCVL